MTDYKLLLKQVNEILAADAYFVPVLSNISALLMDTIPHLNWAGFYLLRSGMLVVGPFQGKPACIHIPSGKGVCGRALAEDRTINVPDVHSFPGHIACDNASKSEIVIPLHINGDPVGVMDIDSIQAGRFTEEDEKGLKEIAQQIEMQIVWNDA